MSTAPTLETALHPPVAPDWVRAAYEGQMRLLERVAEAGVAITEQTARIAKEAWSVEGVELAALAHARAARSVRLSLMLQARIIKALQALERGDVAGGSAAAQRARTRIQAIVGGVIMGQGGDADQAEQLVEELAERLDREDLDEVVASRPFSEVVEMICRDLGLTPDWSVLAEEDWAKAEVASGVVGWPLADRRLTGLDLESRTAAASHGPLAPRLGRGSG